MTVHEKNNDFPSHQIRKKIKLHDGRWTSVTIGPEYLEALKEDVLNMSWNEIAYGLDPAIVASKGLSMSQYIKTKIAKELIKTIRLSNKLRKLPSEVRVLLKKKQI